MEGNTGKQKEVSNRCEVTGGYVGCNCTMHRCTPCDFLPSLSHTLEILNCGSGPENGHETALELVSGANFGCVLHHLSRPTRWNGSWGQVRPEICQKTNKKYNL